MPNLADLTAISDEVVDSLTLMQRVADRTLELIPAASGVAIGLVDGGGATYVAGAGTAELAVGTRVDKDSSLSGLAIQSATIQQSRDTLNDPRVDAAACRRLLALSLICVPMIQSQRAFGVLAVNSSAPNAFDDQDVAVLTELAEFMSVTIGSACELQRISDQLLSLPDPPATSSERGDSVRREASSRYVLSVLAPNANALIDARRRIQGVLDAPDAVTIVVQPIVDLLTGDTMALEALARFDASPPRPPDAWFADAQRVGLGIELETLAVARAVALAHLIPDEVMLNINVGPEAAVSQPVRDALLGAPLHRIILELTEHEAFDCIPGLITDLERLRATGIRIAVDDAGSGYSSLAHIVKMAPEFIKLDRYLISGVDLDPVRRCLVSALVEFATKTGAKIIAEGIETQDELDTVRRLGVHYGQGFYLGRPRSLLSKEGPPMQHWRETDTMIELRVP